MAEAGIELHLGRDPAAVSFCASATLLRGRTTWSAVPASSSAGGSPAPAQRTGCVSEASGQAPNAALATATSNGREVVWDRRARRGPAPALARRPASVRHGQHRGNIGAGRMPRDDDPRRIAAPSGSVRPRRSGPRPRHLPRTLIATPAQPISRDANVKPRAAIGAADPAIPSRSPLAQNRRSIRR
jgi:hypothetical protein